MYDSGAPRGCVLSSFDLSSKGEGSQSTVFDMGIGTMLAWSKGLDGSAYASMKSVGLLMSQTCTSLPPAYPSYEMSQQRCTVFFCFFTSVAAVHTTDRQNQIVSMSTYCCVRWRRWLFFFHVSCCCTHCRQAKSLQIKLDLPRSWYLYLFIFQWISICNHGIESKHAKNTNKEGEFGNLRHTPHPVLWCKNNAQTSTTSVVWNKIHAYMFAHVQLDLPVHRQRR